MSFKHDPRKPAKKLLVVLKQIKFIIFRFFYDHFHNILRFFDVLTSFPLTTSETMRDYYL